MSESSSSAGTRRGRGSKVIGSVGAASGVTSSSDCRSTESACGNGTSLGLPLRASVSTVPIFTVIGRRDTAGPSAMNVPRARSRIDSA